MKAQINRVLIVDDFELMRTMLKNILQDAGIAEFLEAINGVDAIGKLNSMISSGQKIDIIFCDWNMPEMNGYDFLKYVRQTEELKDIPFIMLTSESEKEFVIKALTAGANDYIIKPVSITIVLKKLQTLRQKLEL